MGAYIKRFSSFADKSFFTLFAILGGVIIWYGRTHHYDVIRLYLFIVSLMIFYGLHCYFSDYFKIRSDKAGDNIYYLGFLYTLISLGVSLYQTTTSDFDPSGIIANFGIAIITTIVGVAGRVLFLQLRDTPQEIENQSLDGLSGAATRLKGTLHNTINDFTIFRTALRQSTFEWQEEWSNAITKNIEYIEEYHKKYIEQFESKNSTLIEEYGKINDTLVDLIAKIDSIDIPPSFFVDKLTQPVDDFRHILKETSDTLLRRVEKIEEIGSSVTNLTEAQSELAHNVKNISKFTNDQVASSKVIINEITQHHRDLNTQLDDKAVAINNLTEEVSRSVTSLDSLFDKLSEQIVQKNEKLIAGYSKNINTISEKNEAMLSALNDQTQAFETFVSTDLVNLSEQINTKITELQSNNNVINQLQNDQNKLSQIFNTVIEKSDMSVDNLKSLTENFNNITQRFTSVLNELSNQQNISNQKLSELIDQLSKIRSNNFGVTRTVTPPQNPIGSNTTSNYITSQSSVASTKINPHPGNASVKTDPQPDVAYKKVTPEPEVKATQPEGSQLPFWRRMLRK